MIKLKKTNIGVNEEETTDAAITIGEKVKSAPELPSFYINQPFFFLIRAAYTGVILFIRKIDAPEE